MTSPTDSPTPLKVCLTPYTLCAIATKRGPGRRWQQMTPRRLSTVMSKTDNPKIIGTGR
jgi:hypothetical protein